jgi:hypothetical protein
MGHLGHMQLPAPGINEEGAQTLWVLTKPTRVREEAQTCTIIGRGFSSTTAHRLLGGIVSISKVAQRVDIIPSSKWGATQ